LMNRRSESRTPTCCVSLAFSSSKRPCSSKQQTKVKRESRRGTAGRGSPETHAPAPPPSAYSRGGLPHRQRAPSRLPKQRETLHPRPAPLLRSPCAPLPRRGPKQQRLVALAAEARPRPVEARCGASARRL
jgi:hypothetical protein